MRTTVADILLTIGLLIFIYPVTRWLSHRIYDLVLPNHFFSIVISFICVWISFALFVITSAFVHAAFKAFFPGKGQENGNDSK